MDYNAKLAKMEEEIMEHKNFRREMRHESAAEEASRLQYWSQIMVNFVGIGYLCLVMAGIFNWSSIALAGMTGSWIIAAAASWKATD